MTDGVRNVWFSRTNRVSGLLVSLLCAALYLYASAAPGPADPAVFGLALCISLAISVLGWIFFVHPQTSATDAHLVIRNPIFAIDARPMGFGLHMANPSRNLLFVTFDSRQQAQRRNA